MAVENLVVDPFEIQGEIEGASKARVFELVAPDVERERLHDSDIADREFFTDYPLVFECRKCVSGRPILCAVFVKPVELIGLECFEFDARVAKIFEAQLVEIIAADPDVDVFAPVILDPLVHDRAAGLEFLDAIRSRSKRRIERRCNDVTPLPGGTGRLPPVLGQDDQLAQDLRQLAIARRIEREGDLALRGALGFDHAPIIGG